MKHQFIADHQDAHSVTALCRVLDISRCGYYAARSRTPSHRARTNAELLARIRRIHVTSRENYGAVKTLNVLRQEGVACGLKRVARLRRLHGIEAVARPRLGNRYQLRADP